MPSSGLLACAVMPSWASEGWRGTPPWSSRGRAGGDSALLLSEARFEQELHLVDGGAPHRAARGVVLGLHELAELRHRGVLGGGGGEFERLRADVRGLARRRVRPLDPAADLVPVLVEEDDDGDG